MTAIHQHRAHSELDAVLSLGSNQGDRELTLRHAVRDIAALSGVIVVAASSIVETSALTPGGVDPDAPDYLNAVLTVRTSLEPHQLLDGVNDIERQHGRVREVPWGDRTLDIDIISLGGITVDTPRLTIPHPRAAERAFVLGPWREIDPGASIVGLGRVDELLARIPEHPRPYPAEALL
ncbi:MAG: 2-amino-4-hydroxy-6-hydroxymethyldihydropteridine diphosphokinase [Rhodoglobus sp.]